ncbi:MAG: recombinase family protein [Gordonia sp. (in: high G+C Gram-positive bacteria)]|uniref:recombinase family protein n=1 Tax=Gordonia sp. (in: high G+C Gram-positive bacteria) TaxID=84139 RepID=UPI003C716661
MDYDTIEGVIATTCAIYCRISNDKGGEGLGVQRQLEDCQELAADLGWTVYDSYSDNDVSATYGRRRPEYERMMADVEAGHVQAIISWNPDRLHRRPAELERFITTCDEHHVKIRTVRAGEMDLSTASGRLVARLLGAAARHEVEQRSERIRRARVQQASKGKHHGGRRCYGWEIDGVTMRPDEADVLRQAADQVLAGVSLREIVADLNARGVPTTTGRGPWSSLTIRSALMSPRVAGLSAHKGAVVGEAEWPPIIDRDKWHALQLIFKDPARKSNKQGSAPRWLGSGLYVCGVCGSNDVRMSIVEGRRRYRCRNRVKGDPTPHVGRDQSLLDEYVQAVIIDRLAMKDTAPLFDTTPVGELDLGALTLDLEALTERRKGLAVLYADGTLTADQLAAGSAEIERRQDDIRQRLAVASVRSPLASMVGPGTVGERWRSLTIPVQRRILDELLTVTILPTKPGRKKNGTYFDYDAIKFEWKK